MENYLGQYIAYLQEERKTSGNTTAAYKRDLDKLVLFLEEHGISDWNKVSFTLLNSYILGLERNGAASATVSRNVSTIKSYFSYLFHMKLIDNEPSLNLKAPKITRKVPEILTIEEMDRLLDTPDLTTPKGIRDKAMLELLYATGIKVTEVISLKVSDINMAMNFITCMDGKKGRMIPFGRPAAKAVSEYLTKVRPEMASNDSDLLFVNCNGSGMSRQGFWKIIKGYGEICGFADRLTPHTFRHSFAAHMILNGADLKSVQEMLGHSDISTTQVYTSFMNSGINSVYANTHPRK